MIKTLIHRVKLFSSPRKEFYLFLKSVLGVTPGKLLFYDIAFIHKSASKTDLRGFPVNNERLEYLGDAILGAVVADYLFKRFPNKDEGFLTQMRSKLVNRSFLTKLTFQTGLDKYVESTTNSKNETSHIYGDAFEALIGALYLDKGYEVTQQVIVKNIIRKYVDIDEVQEVNTNFKSQLIEWGQKNKVSVEFETKEEARQQANLPPFLAVVKIDGQKKGNGRGFSKKEAQQQAAKSAYEKMNNQGI